MVEANRLILIHGLGGSSQGFKANFLRGLFPNIITPDFEGDIVERMALLNSILSDKSGWVIIGSSLGGLMGTLFTCRNPAQVRKLILLAPAIVHAGMWPGFGAELPEPISVPTVIYHGQNDDVVPIHPVRNIAEQLFLDLTFHTVDADPRLFNTVQSIDWHTLLVR